MGKAHGERAFSLLEVVVTLGIFALLVLPLANILTGGMARVTTAKAIFEATTLLQRAVEEVKQADFGSIISTVPTKYPTINSPYYLQTQAQDRPDRKSVDGSIAMKEVTLTIFHDDGGSIGDQLVQAQIILYRHDGL